MHWLSEFFEGGENVDDGVEEDVFAEEGVEIRVLDESYFSELGSLDLEYCV